MRREVVVVFEEEKCTRKWWLSNWLTWIIIIGCLKEWKKKLIKFEGQHT